MNYLPLFFVILLVNAPFCSLATESDDSVESSSEQSTEGSEGSKATEATESSDEGFLNKAGKVAKDASAAVSKKLGETRERRENSDYLLLFNYSPLDLIIPSKYGLTMGLIRDADKSWEIEYVEGSFAIPFIVDDLGKMSDKRYSLIGRSYFGGNSFNFSYGLSYFDFSLFLGDKILNQVTNSAIPAIDLVEIQSFGVNFGLGHRWTFNRDITFGVDWISLAQPLLITKNKSAFLEHSTNQKDKDDVENAMRVISYFPRLSFFKLQVGILF